MRRLLLLIVPSLLILAVFIAAPGGPPPPVTFTHGIASGDITDSSAILWTRVDQTTKLTLEVSTNPNFSGKVIRQKVEASAASDFTIKALVDKLKPGKDYFFRFRGRKSMSDVGTFQTASGPAKSVNVSFAYSGDSDGFGIPFPFGDFGVLDANVLEDPDFWVYLGDTIYSDSGLRPGGAATTLIEYRDAYKVNRDIAALPNLLKNISTYTLWDDHEVLNDYAGQTVDPTRYANGRQAFFEYMPISGEGLLQDSTCAGDPLFRVFPWGTDVDIIILDERSCRSADVEATCSFAPGVADLAPTAPSFLRVAFGLPPSPPAG